MLLHTRVVRRFILVLIEVKSPLCFVDNAIHSSLAYLLFIFYFGRLHYLLCFPNTRELFRSLYCLAISQMYSCPDFFCNAQELLWSLFSYLFSCSSNGIFFFSIHLSILCDSSFSAITATSSASFYFGSIRDTNTLLWRHPATLSVRRPA